MTPEDQQRIRRRVLGALAANRTPGFHFAGHFFGVSFDRMAPRAARVSLEAGPHTRGPRGDAHIAVVAMLADITLGTCIRAALGSSSQRLATVSLHLQLTGAPLSGRLEGEGNFEGFQEQAASAQGLGRFALRGNGTLAAYGSGAFMPLAPPAGTTMHPVLSAEKSQGELAEDELDAGELAILDRATRAMAADERSFVDAFLGIDARREVRDARGSMPNGPHVGNRVGHAQGGLLVGFGATTAGEALGQGWRLSAASAWFVSPGEGPELRAQSAVWHQGRDTAVVRTEIFGENERRVLEMVSAHSRAGAKG